MNLSQLASELSGFAALGNNTKVGGSWKMNCR